MGEKGSLGRMHVCVIFCIMYFLQLERINYVNSLFKGEERQGDTYEIAPVCLTVSIFVSAGFPEVETG